MKTSLNSSSVMMLNILSRIVLVRRLLNVDALASEVLQYMSAFWGRWEDRQIGHQDRQCHCQEAAPSIFRLETLSLVPTFLLRIRKLGNKHIFWSVVYSNTRKSAVPLQLIYSHNLN
jgi:hypothetical protein